MLHLFTGADRTTVRNALTNHIEKHLPPEATLTTIDATEYEAGSLSDALGANSLFGGEQWFVIDTPSSDTVLNEETLGALAEMADSQNVFLVMEGAMLAPERKKYEKHAASVEVIVAEKAARFDMFALTEALASRDKRRLWLLLQEARLNGIRDEETIGILWWQLKALRIAAVSQGPDDAGMKAFPFNKAKGALAKFPVSDVVVRSQALLSLVHDARAGKRELDIALEEWVLS